MYRNGDLINLFQKKEFDVIIHQVNCFRVGAGIAKQIIQQYPIVDLELRRYFANRKSWEAFGTILNVKVDEEQFIINMFSQFSPGACTYSGIDSFDIRKSALVQCLRTINHIPNIKSKKIGIPLIASGIAADQKKKGRMTDLEYFQNFIEPIIKTECSNLNLTVVVYENS